jgi:hypothetical protein
MAKMKRTRQSIQRKAEPPVDRSISAADDVNVEHPLGPLEEASVSLRPDLASGDAGADFADELGRSYLRAATTGEDIGEIADEDGMDASEIGGPFLEIEIDAPDETDTDEDIDEDGLRLIGGAVALAPNERDEKTPATEGSSGETPAEVEQEGDWEWPDEKTPVYRSTAERAGR